MKKKIILFLLLFLNLVFTSCGKRVVVWKRPVPSKNLMLQALAEISGVFIEIPSYGYKKEEKEINDLSYLINFLNLIKHKKYKELEKHPSFYVADYYNKELSIYGFKRGYYPNYYPVKDIPTDILGYTYEVKYKLESIGFMPSSIPIESADSRDMLNVRVKPLTPLEITVFFKDGKTKTYYPKPPFRKRDYKIIFLPNYKDGKYQVTIPKEILNMGIYQKNKFLWYEN